MMNLSHALITLGIAVLIIGLLLKFAPWLISWFGSLPGDIKIHNKNVDVFIPITSMIVVSLLLSLIARLFFRK